MVVHQQRRRTPREVKKGLLPNKKRSPHSEMVVSKRTTSEYVVPKIPRLAESPHSGSPMKQRGEFSNIFSRGAIPIWKVELSLLNGAQASSHLPLPISSSEQFWPSTISRYTFLMDNSSIAVTRPPTVFAPVRMLPPPSPPPNHLSPILKKRPFTNALQRTPPLKNNFKKSLLQEIQNADKGKLRHVDHTSEYIKHRESPINDDSLFLAIQAELEKRREYIVTNSDRETDSTNSEWTD